ncbi:MAG: (d)CMP kinase [Armatimonadetes bacterium]|nr:(d)CMP kinase [Armatimonadota bacterium]
MSAEHLPVVAIDGPAGAGKSTVARMLAHRLGLRILDTGAMYRAVALKCRRLGVESSDGEGVARVCNGTVVGFGEGDPPPVLLDGVDVSSEVRNLEIGQAASELSVHSAVRRAVVARQKELLGEGGFVLEGRDTTTVVAPDADLKVFLTASIEERARRRWLELQAKGGHDTLQEVVVDVVQRDHRDYSRADSPLALAEDAVLVETFGLRPPEVVDRILSVYEARFGPV